MKKFMTVLLVIAVMFTFSFSTAFAAEKTYSAAEVEAELELAKGSFITVAEAQKANVFAQYTFDTDGYATVDSVKVTKEAIEVAFEAVVEELEELMAARIETIVDGLDATATYTKSTLDGYKATVLAGLTYEAAGISSYLNGQPALFAAQAPLTKDATVAKMEKDYAEADYPAKGEFVDANAATTGVTGKLTAQQVISQVKAEAVKAIAEADKTLAAELKTAGTNKSAQTAAYKKVIAAYGTAYTAIASRIANFTDDGEAVKNNEGVAADDKQDALAAATRIAAFKQYVYGTYYNNAMNNYGPSAWASFPAVYVADTTGTGATVFGVHIAKVSAPTTAETKAFKAAMAEAIDGAVKAAEVYYEAGNTTNLANDPSGAVNNALALAAKYQDVVDYGNKLKAHYVNGVKTYDDAKVDAVVAAAEAIVYADLDETAANFKAKTAEGYIELAAEKVHEKAYAGINEALDALENTSASLLAKFEKAQADAVKKFYSVGTTAQIKVLYGTNKTAEEDIVYLKAGYAVAEDWTKIANKAVAAINAAESYADIEAALATAKAELAKITPADDATKLANLKIGYKSAIDGYAAQKEALADAKVYTLADFDAAAVLAKAEIDKAKTLAEADAKYAEAQAIVDSVVPTADREAAEAAVKAAIKALPAASKVTLADAATVDAVRAQLDAYNKIPGKDAVSATRLVAAEDKVFELEAKVLAEELKAMAKKVKAIGTGVDDATIAAALAAKAEVVALNDKVEAFNDEIDAYVEAYGVTAANAYKIASADATAVANFEGTIYDDEMVTARYAIAAIGTDLENADAAKVVAAREAFDKLTDKQQYTLEYWGERLATAEKNVAGVEEAAKIAAIEGIKIKANSSAKKGSITVKWTVDEEVEGVKYQVYKSTKAQKGYKKAITTSKTSFKNTKNLEKGTRYFYKVRAIGEVDGVTYYSDWSNKANRIAK